jgi:hypothetical protein
MPAWWSDFPDSAGISIPIGIGTRAAWDSHSLLGEQRHAGRDSRYRWCEGGFSHQDNMIVVLAISDDNLALGRMAAPMPRPCHSPPRLSEQRDYPSTKVEGSLFDAQAHLQPQL